jgi:hypothetical protein
VSRPRVKDADISTLTVLRVVHDLRPAAKTADEIADYLVADPTVVLALLVELKAKRILRDRTRGAGPTRRREWRRWEDR